MEALMTSMPVRVIRGHEIPLCCGAAVAARDLASAPAP